MNFSLMSPNQKMLTPQEETALLEEWLLYRDTEELSENRKREAALERILRAFSPLVSKFARTFALYGIQREDLISVGNLALVETAKRFEPERNFKFSTYAQHWIRGTMLIYIASNYFSFSLKSQKMKKIFFSLRRVLYTEQRQNIDFDSIMDKMSDDFGVTRTKLDEVYAMIRSPITSFEQPIDRTDGDYVTLGDTISDDELDPEETLIGERLDHFQKDLVRSTMNEVLKDRERIIIAGQMLTEEGEEKTLQDLADEFGLSRERVRQIRNNALQKLDAAIRQKCHGIEPQAIF